MQKRATLTIMLVMAVLAFAWQPLMLYVAHKMGWDIRPPVAETTQPTPESTTQPTSLASTNATTVPATGVRVISANRPSSETEIGSRTEKDSAFRMGVKLNPQGAGTGRTPRAATVTGPVVGPLADAKLVVGPSAGCVAGWVAAAGGR